MMTEILRARLKVAAEKLGPLLPDVVFLGGGVIPLLLTDRGARDVRSTDDIDVIVSIASMVAWYEFQTKLAALGFRPAPAGPICRFVHGALVLDVMPKDPAVLGFGNRWYDETMTTAASLVIEDQQLRIITAPCFVATKLEAYGGRGNDDIIMSHDIEDIVVVMDGRPELAAEISTASEPLRAYLAHQMTMLTQHRNFAEAIEGHLAGDYGRAQRAMKFMSNLAASK
jgi:hypothetical protein